MVSRPAWRLLGALLPLVAAGCSPSSATGDLTVTVSPASATVQVKGSQHFTASVGGSSDPSIDWSLDEAAVAGTISTTGIYFASSTAGVYHVRATLHADPSRSAAASVEVQAAPGSPTIASFTASPSSIQPGQGSTLSWSVSGATSLSIDNGVGTVTGSSKQVSPTATTTYRLTATNAAGSVSATAQVSVQQKPVISSFAASPTSITAGQSSTLSWSASGATSLSIDNGVGTVTGSSKQVSPTATTTYTLTATNAAGSVTATAMVTVGTTGGTGLFPVVYSSNRRYLQDQSGAPFPILGRTAWFVTSLSPADYKTFIDDTVAKGFDAIEFHVVNHDDRGNHAPYGNGGTLLPFLKRLDGGSWTGSISYGNPANEAPDFSTPNEAYWSFVDGLLSYAESKGVLCFMFPAYWGYGGGQQGWGVEIKANGAARMASYGTFISTRYQNQPNIVWMAGGDYGNSGAAFSSTETPIEKAMLDAIDGVAGRESIYWAAEWSYGQSVDQTNFGARMTLNGTYDWGGGQSVYREAWLSTPTEPAFNLESPYDQEGPDGLSWNPNATQPVRRFLWWSILGTIGGYITGNGYVWTFTSGWQNHLNTQGAQDLARLNAFYRSIAWQKLVPTNLGGSKNLIVAGGSSDSAADWVAAAADPAGSVLVAYVPPAHSGSITVDMTALSGTAQARWFNPTTAAYTAIGSFPNSGTHVFTPPGDNGTGYDDWVLVITSP